MGEERVQCEERRQGEWPKAAEEKAARIKQRQI